MTKGAPADGRLETGDVILRVEGEPVSTSQDVVDAVTSAPAGEPVPFVVSRDGARTSVQVTPDTVDGKPQVGISVGGQVSKSCRSGDHQPRRGIGGPSAGLMFSSASTTRSPPARSPTARRSPAPGRWTPPVPSARSAASSRRSSARDAGATAVPRAARELREALALRTATCGWSARHHARRARGDRAWVKDPDADLPQLQGGGP